MRHLLRIALGLGWIALLAGVVLQLVVRDRYESLAVFFYAMPKPCLAFLAVTLLVWPGSPRQLRALAAAAVVSISAWWFAVSWGHGVPPISPASQSQGEEVRVLFWNLNRPAGIQQDMVALMKEFQPHFAAFVEPGPNARTLCAEYEALLPGYKADFMPRGILWLARVPSRYRDRGKLDGVGGFARFDVNGLGPTFPMVVADVYSQTFRSRSYQLLDALSKAQGRSDAIIAGDFNTPGESLFFEPYRAHYRDALETAGEGFRETWPVGLPLLSLDHLWVGTDWEIVEARSVHRWSSDHKAVLVTVRRK